MEQSQIPLEINYGAIIDKLSNTVAAEIKRSTILEAQVQALGAQVLQLQAENSELKAKLEPAEPSMEAPQVGE